MTRRVVANLLFLYQKCNQICTLKITQDPKTKHLFSYFHCLLYIPKITQDPKTYRHYNIINYKVVRKDFISLLTTKLIGTTLCFMPTHLFNNEYIKISSFE